MKKKEPKGLEKIIGNIIAFLILYLICGSVISCVYSCVATDDTSTQTNSQSPAQRGATQVNNPKFAQGQFDTTEQAYQYSQQHGRIKICGVLQKTSGWFYKLQLSENIFQNLPIDNSTEAWEPDEGRYICITGRVGGRPNETKVIYDAIRP